MRSKLAKDFLTGALRCSIPATYCQTPFDKLKANHFPTVAFEGSAQMHLTNIF